LNQIIKLATGDCRCVGSGFLNPKSQCSILHSHAEMAKD
jgi:hypothetical protein